MQEPKCWNAWPEWGLVTRPTVLHGKATRDYHDQGEDLRLIMVWEEDEFPTGLWGGAGETGKE